MHQPITMPALSDTMSNGRLIRWLKKIGDAIKKGESIAEVETDKAVMEVEAFHDGYLAGPLSPEDTEMPVGQVIGYVADSPAGAASGTTTPAPATPSPPTPSPPNAASPPPEAVVQRLASEPARAPDTAPGVRASPYARRLAQQRGVDLSKLGTAATVVHADSILDAARSPPMPDLGVAPGARVSWPSRVRQSVARNMIKSLAIPTFHVVAQLSIGPIRKAAGDAQVSLTLLLARAGALAVKANPLFNAAYTPDGLAMRQRVDVGIAVDTPDGLIPAVLRDVSERTVPQLAADWRSLRERVNSRRLKPGDYQSATFYLSNLGTFSVVHSFDAVLPLGAAAILCVGAAEGDRTIFTLGCDHRVVAGADAARFLQSLAQLLADPDKLWGVKA